MTDIPFELQVIPGASQEAERNYSQFVRELTSPPETYNLSAEVLWHLNQHLGNLVALAHPLDHLKRVITYGEKLRMISPLQIPNNGWEALAGQNTSRLLVHGLLGKITEALELVPILTAVLAEQPVDLINLIEELGDDEFYTSLIRTAAETDRTTTLRRNVRKLRKRYKGGVFTAEEALRRQLDEERKELEKTDGN